ncbi:putative terpene synthase 9 [Nymphaea thermarum]|nr:putative terpene synthase 9 [Nymphaea thermarum]
MDANERTGDYERRNSTSGPSTQQHIVMETGSSLRFGEEGSDRKSKRDNTYGNLLKYAWRRLNTEQLLAQQQQQQTAFSRSFMNVALKIVRVSQCMYDYEDGVGVLEHESMDCVCSLIAKPI